MGDVTIKGAGSQFVSYPVFGSVQSNALQESNTEFSEA
jgi:hypothetical protein